MKYERQIIWALIVILFVLILFPRVVSGYTPAPEMSLMDLKEYSSLPDSVKNTYRNLVSSNVTTISNLTSFGQIQNVTGHLLDLALEQKVSQVSVVCEPGTYSESGTPPCTPCPVNTYCPAQNSRVPINCPLGFTSHVGSKSITECIAPPKST